VSLLLLFMLGQQLGKACSMQAHQTAWKLVLLLLLLLHYTSLAMLSYIEAIHSLLPDIFWQMLSMAWHVHVSLPLSAFCPCSQCFSLFSCKRMHM
jgi:hypothetical protein